MGIGGYCSIEINSSFSKFQIKEIEPLTLNIEIKGFDKKENTINIGWANIFIFDEEVIDFEIEDGDDGRQSESFKSIRYINSLDEEYFEAYHPQTTTVFGRVAYLDRISIEKEFRGNGYGTLAIKDIFLYLCKYLLVDFILLFPYPFEWDKVDGESKNETLISQDTEKVISLEDQGSCSTGSFNTISIFPEKTDYIQDSIHNLYIIGLFFMQLL
jgi:hypothetical protein